ncbi:uncharacterized protein LOC133530354 [Cydia pomonella]|uniref:uncharacterized protein LOC133530354 n=1 Tax=Cydia pomonella TaxID=82600 RepID=UPI002ADD9FD8|nr:uncharacterized protein LOC133530354 [Cydia pomonella]
MIEAATMEAKQTLQKLLKKIAEEQEYEDYSDVKEASNSASVMSSLFHVMLRSDGKKDLKLFAKVAGWNENLRKRLVIHPFTAELKFYRTVRTQYEELEENCSIPKEHRFPMPKVYGSSDEYFHETLVMEDLVAEGYAVFDRQHTADLEYMSTGIAVMAQFHALSLAYHQNYPENFASTRETMKMGNLKLWLESVIAKLLANACSAAEKHKDKLQKYFENPEKLYLPLLSHYQGRNENILVHGDFKPSNLMHRRKDGKLEIVVVDFQMVHDGDPVTDLMYFIFTATDESLRRAHYQELLDLYYEQLRGSLLRLHVDPEKVYSENTYRSRLAECNMLGLAMAVGFLPLVLVEEGKAPAFNKEDTDLTAFAVESSALFKERFNGVLNNYVEWGLL